MGIGAGIGGFAEGFASGVRLKSEMKDAEARRELTKLQTEAAGLQVGALKDEREYQNERKKIFSEPDSQKADESAAGIAWPGEDPGAATSRNVAPSRNAAETPQAISPSGGTPTKPAAAPLSDFDRTMQVHERLKALDMKYGKISPLEALKQGREFQKLQQEGVIDALRHYSLTKDTEGALKIFNQSGTKAPEGTTFKEVEREAIPGVPQSKQRDVVAVLPTGQEISFMDSMYKALNPAQLADITTKTGLGVAELAIKKQAEDRAARQGDQLYELTKLKYDKLISEQQAQTRIALERLGLAKDEAKYVKTQQAFTGAYMELANTVGIQRNFDPTKASPDEIRQHQGKLLQAATGQSIFEMNFDLKAGKPTFSPQQSLEIGRFALSNKDKVQQDPETGFYFIEMGKRKAYVPGTFAPKQEAAPGSAAPQQEGPRGIKIPSGPVVQGRPFYNANQSDLLRMSTKPRGISTEEAMQAQAELDARKGEARLSGR